VTTADAAFGRGLDVFGDVIERVPPDAWEMASPCAGWTALDVLGHLSSSLLFGIAVLKGQQSAWPAFDRPADLVHREPIESWRTIAEDARAALPHADLSLEMDTPMGRSTCADRLAFPAIDRYVHAWDVGRSIGTPVTAPDDIIESAHRAIDPLPVERVRGPGGAFGPETDTPVDATATERFIAWTGRLVD
jgi:uncharacterized protein (TIGR03086 family)